MPNEPIDLDSRAPKRRRRTQAQIAADGAEATATAARAHAATGNDTKARTIRAIFALLEKNWNDIQPNPDGQAAALTIRVDSNGPAIFATIDYDRHASDSIAMGAPEPELFSK